MRGEKEEERERDKDRDKEEEICQLLLEEVTTNKKKVVGWEINGWLETSQKNKQGKEVQPVKRRAITAVQSMDHLYLPKRLKEQPDRKNSEFASIKTRNSTRYQARTKASRDNIQKEEVKDRPDPIYIKKFDLNTLNAD